MIEYPRSSGVMIDLISSDKPRPTISAVRLEKLASDAFFEQPDFAAIQNAINQALREAGVTVTARKDDHE